MAYRQTLSLAHDNDHKLNLVGTANFRAYSVDKYLCECGAEAQIASNSKIGVWLSDKAEKPCEKAIH